MGGTEMHEKLALGLGVLLSREAPADAAKDCASKRQSDGASGIAMLSNGDIVSTPVHSIACWKQTAATMLVTDQQI